MASNSFGTIFRITTWGESHGKAVGVVIDGCPSGIPISIEEINFALSLRAPGKRGYTSPRNEPDVAEFLSGIFEGKTTGTPISILIPNQDVDSTKYMPIKDLIRPGHANYTYMKKYGIFDYRGGGRASARETACRVAAGAIAKKFLTLHGIDLLAYISQIGSIPIDLPWNENTHLEERRKLVHSSPIFCPGEDTAICALLKEIQAAGDSLGGIVEFIATPVPVGLGDPIYEKLEAKLAYAMMSLPASKGFEIGLGFRAVTKMGSEHNDLFTHDTMTFQTKTNSAGGTLGGISNGMPITGRVAFKPTSSILKTQETVTLGGDHASLELPSGSRHDPCVAIRAVPVVEAMLALVLADALLMQKCAQT